MEQSKKCSKCGEELPEDYIKCPNCGNTTLVSLRAGAEQKENYSSQLLHVSAKDEGNQVAKIFKLISWVVFGLGLIAGFVLGKDEWGDFSFLPALGVWVGAFLAGMTYIGISEIIQLLQKISDK